MLMIMSQNACATFPPVDTSATLPPYLVFDDDTSLNRGILRAQANKLIFPLSDEDQKSIDVLIKKFKSEENAAGLAAPQIGDSKRIIVFHITENAKKIRNDIDAILPMTVLINPEYSPLGEEKAIDWEGCFSVKTVMAEVPRYTTISYHGFDVHGNEVQGIAKGFFARLLQHEIGHLNGELFIDLITPECRSGSIEEMRALRLKEMEDRKRREADLKAMEVQ